MLKKSIIHRKTDGMTVRADHLKALVLGIVPDDGTPIGNYSLLAALQAQKPKLTEPEYKAARDALIKEGELAKGRGRGGSVYRIISKQAEDDSTGEEADEESDDELEADFELEMQELPTNTTVRRSKPKPKRRAKASESPAVLSYRHPDKRANNPEVGMVHPDNDPDQPQTVWKYDPHLDPVLQFDSGRARVENLIDDALASGDTERMREALFELKRLQRPYLEWTGKAERTSFNVDTVSLYVHERIDPASILATIRKRLKGEKDSGEKAFQPDLFSAPFENLPLRQALDFYRHEKNWSNRLIAGDSFLVMNSLLQKESMAGQVQMIYIDPPYGIKYGSNFQPFTNKREVKDGADADLTQEPEMLKAFRDTWELGIHSYLTYLRDRLVLAKDLLHESGSVFVQISNENLHHTVELLDEIYGTLNRVSVITFRKTSGAGSISGKTNTLAAVSDYLVWYAKDKGKVKYNQLYLPKEFGGEGASQYLLLEEQSGARRRMTKRESEDASIWPQHARPFGADNLTSASGVDKTRYDVKFQQNKRGRYAAPSKGKPTLCVR